VIDHLEKLRMDSLTLDARKVFIKLIKEVFKKVNLKLMANKPSKWEQLVQVLMKIQTINTILRYHF
jgi:hypothetical protein